MENQAKFRALEFFSTRIMQVRRGLSVWGQSGGDSFKRKAYMRMLIDGVPSEELVQRSIDRGLVQRPVNLQPTLTPEEQKELTDYIQAARRRLLERQKKQAEAHKLRQLPPNAIIIDGVPAKEIAEQSIKMGLARRRSRKKIRSYEERLELARKQRRWVRESTRKWRAKKKAEKEAAAALIPTPATNPENN